MAKRSQLIRYGISIGIDTADLARDTREANKVVRRLNREIGRTDKAVREYKHAQKDLRHEFKAGRITKEQYLEQLRRERLRRDKATGALEKYRKSQRLANQQRKEAERAIARQRREQEQLNRARAAAIRQQDQMKSRRWQQMGGYGAGGLSAMGLGGKAAGAARMVGGLGAAGMLSGGLGMGIGAGLAGGLGLMYAGDKINNAIDTYAALEGKLVDLKVLYGEMEGEKLGQQFKELAKSTALTTSQLVNNAQVWASYGLTTDGIVERMRRLGEVTGGQTDKFHALTVAFAQVNAQGKLMGQEKNQLINAGFSLKAVAEAAGIEMKDFAKAMENGAISAEHLNEALVKMTDEGGLYYGLLDEKAKSLEGQATIVQSKWEEANQAVGKNFQHWRKFYNDASGAMADWIKTNSEWVGSQKESGWMSYLFGSDTSKQKFETKGGYKGGWAGSYNTAGGLKTGLGSTITAGANHRTTLIQHLMNAAIDAQQEGRLIPRANPTAKKYMETDMKVKLLRQELAKTGLLYGTSYKGTARTDAQYRAMQAGSAWEKEDAKMRAERAAADDKKMAEQSAKGNKFFTKEYEKYRYNTGKAGGFDQDKLNKTLHIFYKAALENHATSDQQKKVVGEIMRIAKEQKMADIAKAQGKARADLMKTRESEMARIMGMVPGDQYAGMSGSARKVFESLEQRNRTIGSQRKGGQSGAIAGGGADYALLAARQSEIDDAKAARKHEEWVKRKTIESNNIARKQLEELKKRNNLLADSSKGGAV